MFKFIKIITKVFYWCKLFKSKLVKIGSAGAESPADPEPYNKTNVTTKRSVSMIEFLLKFCSDRLKRVVREKVIPILKVVADETKNDIDDKIVKYLEELLKPEPKPIIRSTLITGTTIRPEPAWTGNRMTRLVYLTFSAI